MKLEKHERLPNRTTMKDIEAAPDRAYTIADASHASGLEMHNIRRLIHDGFLPAFQLPGQRVFRIRGTDIIRMMNGELAA
ncbi:hypothetical protein [Ruegeria arenilitoris]|uniref:hypothetical protein n=1 Tax=Ruegeria arenilitoris TaxID=1173585 RepID=UPI00147FF2F3|nr:hypothetical protein [Ruegeria arenilitoris]